MDDLAALARDACRRFSQTFEPVRPELYRYCKHLTRSPWDAEDLAQDTHGPRPGHARHHATPRNR